MKNVKNHFQGEAKEFDDIIIKLVPYYKEMVEALVNAIPFDNKRSISVMDLGVGTGTISLAVKDRFPKARITCLDLASNMLEVAKNKLKEHKADLEFIEAAFAEDNFSKKYDVVVSSLALHHLITDQDKKDYYKVIFNGLNNGGVFYNADVILGETEYEQQMFLEKWKEFMRRSVSEDEIENKWLVKYKEEDHPAKLSDHFKWLAESGFNNVGTIWKYYGGAVFGGIKL